MTGRSVFGFFQELFQSWSLESKLARLEGFGEPLNQVRDCSLSTGPLGAKDIWFFVQFQTFW